MDMIGYICGNSIVGIHCRQVIFSDDLRNLLGVFRELKGKSIYKQSSMDKFVNESISEYGSGQS
jgi:hypothetical protein